MPSVTIAISALNEEITISRWLNSVVRQKQIDFKIEKIIIHSDGSTDNTVNIIKSFNDNRIIVHDHKKRMGKSYRLNQIYRELDTDFLIQSDADVVFAHENVVSEMIKQFKDPQVAMVGGNILPMPPETFTERAVMGTVNAYRLIRTEYKSGNNRYSATGAIIAYKNSFCKSLKIPSDMIGNDVFTYFECIRNGFKYMFAPKAIVMYRLPQNIKDQLKQNSRNKAADIRHKRFFGESLVNHESTPTKGLMYAALFNSFISQPIYFVYIFIINSIGGFLARKKERSMNGKWEMVSRS